MRSADWRTAAFIASLSRTSAVTAVPPISVAARPADLAVAVEQDNRCALLGEPPAGRRYRCRIRRR